MQRNERQAIVEERYELIRTRDGRILVFDTLDPDMKTVEPSCGVDAEAVYQFLKNSPKHGLAEAQQLLGDIVAGGRPITEMVQEIRERQAMVMAEKHCLPAPPRA